MKMPDPKEQLILEIEKKMDLFQTTAGKANANIISTTTIIFNGLAHTIMAQYDEIMKIKAEQAKSDKGWKDAEEEIKKLNQLLKNSLPEPKKVDNKPTKISGVIKEASMGKPNNTIPDETIT